MSTEFFMPRACIENGCKITAMDELQGVWVQHGDKRNYFPYIFILRGGYMGDIREWFEECHRASDGL